MSKKFSSDKQMQNLFEGFNRFLNESKILNESAILDWIGHQSQTSAGGVDAEGNMRGEPIVSREELQKAKYIVQDAMASEDGLKDQEAIAFLVDLGPRHDDNSIEAKKFNAELQSIIHPSLRGNQADQTKRRMEMGISGKEV